MQKLTSLAVILWVLGLVLGSAALLSQHAMPKVRQMPEGLSAEEVTAARVYE